MKGTLRLWRQKQKHTGENQVFNQSISCSERKVTAPIANLPAVQWYLLQCPCITGTLRSSTKTHPETSFSTTCRPVEFRGLLRFWSNIKKRLWGCISRPDASSVSV